MCAVMLWGGPAAAMDTRNGMNTSSEYLIFPTWQEVMDIINQGKEKDKDTATPPKPFEGAFHPYIGLLSASPETYLVPGNMLDVSGGLSYYSPNTGKIGSVGMIIAVKDKISNRLTGYTFEPENLTTYISLSINY